MSNATGGLRALRHRNYRLFFVGQAISMLGRWMQTVALGWFVYRITDSALLLGVAGFLSQIPSLFLAPLAGVWLDSGNRRRILLAMQVLSLLQATALAIFVLSGFTAVEPVLTLSLFQGFVGAVDVPARQSLLVRMVEGREDLTNAIALNSASFNAARLVGPSLAGVVIALWGEGAAFLLNAISYVPVIVALLAIHDRDDARGSAAGRTSSSLGEGIDYVIQFTPIRRVLYFVAAVCFVAVPYSVLMPIFARDVYQGGPRTMGFLVGAIGVGALCGSLYVVSRASVRGAGRVISRSGLVFGVALVALALARDQRLAMAALVLAGFGNTTLLASSNTFLQTVVDEDKRGRVMSFYTMAQFGVTPVGIILVGAIAGRIGAPATVLVCGVACTVSTILFQRAIRTEQTLTAEARTDGAS